MDALQAVLELALGAVQLGVRLGQMLELLVELLLDLGELLRLEGVEVDWARRCRQRGGGAVAVPRGGALVSRSPAMAPGRRRLLPDWRDGARVADLVPGLGFRTGWW